MFGCEWCILNYNTNEEGSFWDPSWDFSLLKEGLNPAFLSCPSNHKDSRVRVAFWVWVFNNNKNQTKIKPPNIIAKKHFSRNSEENAVCTLVCVGSKIWAEKKGLYFICAVDCPFTCYVNILTSDLNPGMLIFLMR